MRVVRNKYGQVVIIDSTLEEKVLGILSRSSEPIKFTELVSKVYGSYDDSKRISLLRVINRLNDKGVVERIKYGGDLYIKPCYSEIKLLYYTSILIPYFAVLNIASSTMALLYHNPYASHITLYYVLISSIALFVIYLLERTVIRS